MTDWMLRTGWTVFRPVAGRLIRKFNRLPPGFDVGKILVVRIQGAGDVLLTTPAVRSLRRRFGDAEIHYLVGDHAVEMLQDNPDVDRIVPVSEAVLFSRSVREMVPLIRSLRKQRYDLGVILSRSAGLHGFLAACGIRFRVGLDKNGSGGLLHVPVTLPGGIRYEAMDYLEVVKSVGGDDCGMDLQLSMTPDEERQTYELLKGAGIDPDLPFGVLSVGGGRNAGWNVPQKRWPTASFAELAARIDLPLAVIGDDEDRRETEGYFQEGNHFANLCGKLSLRDAAVVIKRSKFLVTNDTVTMHMAVIMKTPSVALFGPTHPTALLPQNVDFIEILQGKLPCVPCFWQNMASHVSDFGESNFPGCPQGDSGSPCMETITVVEVAERVKSIVNPVAVE